MVESITHAQLISHSHTQDAIVHISGMQSVLSIAFQNLFDMRQFIVVVLHSFYLNHCLMLTIDGKSLVFHHLCNHIHLGQLTDACQKRMICCHCLSLDRHHFDLWVQLRKEGRYHIVKTVKHTQCHHQCHGSDSNAHYGDTANHIDSVSTLLREEVAACDVKREVHFFSSSSIWSI